MIPHSEPPPRPIRERPGRAAAAYRTWQVLSLAVGAAIRAFALARTKSLRSETAQKRKVDALWAAEGRRLRERAIRMGGLLVKVGQFLSTRADLLPASFLRELAPLQDALPPVRWAEIRPLLIEAYGKPPEGFFPALNPLPDAAASLAQVHFARLPDGREVALKILRPGIAGQVEVDLSAMRTVAGWAQRWTTWGRRLDLLAIWQEFAEVTRGELDMFGEAKRARRFFDLYAGDPGIGVPLPIDDWVRPGILVLERVRGLRPDRPEALRKAGLDPKQISQRLIQSYMHQWLGQGFYHADPHPGNLFISPKDGSITYVDFGMMAEISAKDRGALRTLVEGLITHDPDRLLQGVVNLGFVRPNVDPRSLRRALAWFLDRLNTARGELTGGEGDAAERLAEDIKEFLFTHPFQIPARYTFLGRALGILRGLVANLDPDRDFMELLVSSARAELNLGKESGASGFGDAAATNDPVSSLRLLLDRLLRHPRQIGRMLDRLDAGEPLPVRVDALSHSLTLLTQTGRRLTRAILAAGAAVAAALVPGHAYFGRDILWVAAAVFAVSSLARGSRDGETP